MRVYLYDAVTDTVKLSVCDVNSFEWTQNNWSCDCNRDITFGGNLEDTGVCHGCKRYFVVGSPGLDSRSADAFVQDANSGYDQSCLRLALDRSSQLFRLI